MGQSRMDNTDNFEHKLKKLTTQTLQKYTGMNPGAREW